MKFLFTFFAVALYSHLATADLETSYVETHQLSVIHNNGDLDFTYNKELLFSLPQHELINFLQVAKDLENFDDRMIATFNWLKPIASLYLGMSSGGLSALLGIGAVVSMPGPTKDLNIERLANNDLKYFGANPNLYAEDPISKIDLIGLVNALIIVNKEYTKRMSGILEFQAQILLDKSLKCNFSEMGVVNASLREQEKTPFFKVSKVQTEEQGLFYSFIVSPDQSRGWSSLEEPFKDTQVAMVHFNSRTLGIRKLFFDYSPKDRKFRKEVRLAEVLATIGRRTRAVNTNYILPNPKIKIVYEWSMILRTCLKYQ